MKRYLLALLVLIPQALPAQPTAELEALLADAEGHNRLGDYSQALPLAIRAEELARAAGRKPELVQALEILGDAHQGQGDADGALASFRESLKLAREIGEQPAIARNLLEIGKIHLAAGRVPAAAETLRRGLTAAADADVPEVARDLHLQLAGAYAAQGRHQQAYGSLRRYEDLRRETEGRGTAERLAELEAQLEAVRQQGEAESASRQREVERQQQRISELESRNRLFKNVALGGGGGLLALLLLTLFSRHRLANRASRVTAELAQKSEQLERTAEQLGWITEQFDQTRKELDDANFELNRAASDRDRVAAKLERSEGELERFSALFDRTSVKLAETSSQLDQTTEELDLTRRELGQTSDQRDRMSKRLEESSTRLAELTESYRQDIAELGDRNAATRDRLAEMERFTSTVTQHLKVILITIRGALGALQQDAVAGDVQQVRKDVERTYATVGRMVQLLDELLKLLLVGRIVKAPEEIAMSELAFEAVAQVSGLVGDRRVEIVIDPGMPSVYGDRAQLLEVLRNLLENGGKFMGLQPTPRLEVSARQDGEQTVFCVRDNGIGIDPHDHERVFALFEQIDPDEEGSGIGLAYVRRILEAHGGRIWVESAGEGRGSTFCFTVAEGRDAEPEPSQEPPDTPALPDFTV